MSTTAARRNGKKETNPPPVFSKKWWTGSGNLEISVWENVTGEGDEERVVLSTTLRKTYKVGEEYKESTSLFPQDLQNAAFLLEEAARFCLDQQNKN